jgi:hypothetical protein
MKFQASYISKIANFFSAFLMLGLVLSPLFFYTLGSDKKTVINCIPIHQHADIRYITCQQDNTLGWLQFAFVCGIGFSILFSIFVNLFLKDKNEAKLNSSKRE